MYCHRLGFKESYFLFGEDLYKVLLIKKIQYQCGKTILLLHSSAIAITITITIAITMTTSKEKLKQKAEAESKRQRRKKEEAKEHSRL